MSRQSIVSLSILMFANCGGASQPVQVPSPNAKQQQPIDIEASDFDPITNIEIVGEPPAAFPHLKYPLGQSWQADVGVITYYREHDNSINSIEAVVEDASIVQKSILKYQFGVLEVGGGKPWGFRSYVELATQFPHLAHEAEKAEKELESKLRASGLNVSVRSNQTGYVIDGVASHSAVACAFFGGGDNHNANSIAFVACESGTLEETNDATQCSGDSDCSDGKQCTLVADCPTCDGGQMHCM